MSYANLSMLLTVGMESMEITQIVDAYKEASNLIKMREKMEERLSELNEELKVPWGALEYYENRNAKIEEIELILAEQALL